MFKVECPGCKAPYQVDERRIPASGLKMRCPKCGTSFKVDSPADGRRPGSGAVSGGALGLGADSESMPPPALCVRSPVPPNPRDAPSRTAMRCGRLFAVTWYGLRTSTNLGARIAICGDTGVRGHATTAGC